MRKSHVHARTGPFFEAYALSQWWCHMKTMAGFESWLCPFWLCDLGRHLIFLILSFLIWNMVIIIILIHRTILQIKSMHFFLLVASVRFIASHLATFNWSYSQETFKGINVGWGKIQDYLFSSFQACQYVFPFQEYFWSYCQDHNMLFVVLLPLPLSFQLQWHIYMMRSVVEDTEPWTRQPRNLDLCPNSDSVLKQGLEQISTLTASVL